MWLTGCVCVCVCVCLCVCMHACVRAHVCVGVGVDSRAHTGDSKITTTYLNLKAPSKSEF